MESNKERPTSLPKFITLTGSTAYSSDEEQASFFRALSEQVGLWSLYNFGDQPPHRPAMGMVEELNELQQGLSELDRDQMLDAIGDVTIYMADYFSKRAWDMGAAWSDANVPNSMPTVEETSSRISKLCKNLSHYHLKGEQGIRGGADKNAGSMQVTCSEVLTLLDRMCNFLCVDFMIVIRDIWGDVSKRDWVKNKNDAHKVATGG